MGIKRFRAAGAVALGVVLTGYASLPARADCLIPGPSPSVPNGLSAEKAEMRAAHDTIQNFVKSLEAYQSCVNALLAAPPKNTPAEVVLAWRAQSDAAIDLATDLADDYKAQIELFKARPQH